MAAWEGDLTWIGVGGVAGRLQRGDTQLKHMPSHILEYLQDTSQDPAATL